MSSIVRVEEEDTELSIDSADWRDSRNRKIGTRVSIVPVLDESAPVDLGKFAASATNGGCGMMNGDSAADATAVTKGARY